MPVNFGRVFFGALPTEAVALGEVVVFAPARGAQRPPAEAAPDRLGVGIDVEVEGVALLELVGPHVGREQGAEDSEGTSVRGGVHSATNSPLLSVKRVDL